MMYNNVQHYTILPHSHVLPVLKQTLFDLISLIFFFTFGSFP